MKIGTIAVIGFLYIGAIGGLICLIALGRVV